METASKREATERGQRWEVETKAAKEAPMLYPSLAILRDEDLARARKKEVVESYLRDGLGNYWKRLVEFFPGDVRSVTAESLERYVAYRKLHAQGQTIQRELKTLKRGLTRAGFPLPRPWPDVATGSVNAKQASKRHDLKDWQHWLSRLEGPAYEVALFAILTGLRWAELYRVQVTDISEVEGGWMALTVREKVKRKHPRKVVLSPLAQLLVDLGCVPFPEADHKRTRRRASKDFASGTITLRDCRSAFKTAGLKYVLGDIVNKAAGHSGVAALYQKEDYDALARLALGVQTWLLTDLVTGTAAGTGVNRQRIDKWASVR